MTRLFLLLVTLVAACGQAQTGITRRPSQGVPATGDLPLAGNAITIGTLKPPSGGTYFDLLAPPLPAGATAVPLQAKLAGPGGTYTLTSFHVTGPTWKGTPVTAGTYTLTYLNEGGVASSYTRSVVVAPGEANYLVVGAIWVSPLSAVNAERIATQGLNYEISGAKGLLKTTATNANSVVSLPPGNWLWSALGINGGRLEALAFESNETITPFEWGSLYVRMNPVYQTLSLQSASGVMLYPGLTDRTEYLLPAAAQVYGCRVYRAIFNLTTTITRTLCSDGSDHEIINVR